MYFNENTIIKEKIIIGSLNHIKEDNLNIAYGIDNNFTLGCVISITSILLANSASSFSFHIFTNQLDDKFQKKLKELVITYNTNVTIYLVDDSTLINLPTTKNWTIATYFRFIIADFFYAKIDKILYLDADIICKGSLHDLFHLNLESIIAYVVAEKDSIWWTKCAQRLNQNKLVSGYFNAGFLFINLNNWQEYNINDKALLLLNDTKISKKLTHLDQDVLNLLLLEKVSYLDRKYNQQVNINYELKYHLNAAQYNPITEDTIFIHYIGPTKPWHKWAKNYNCSSYFLNVKAHSPWDKDPLLSASSSTQMRYCAKHELHQKKIIAGIICYLKYYFKKLKIH